MTQRHHWHDRHETGLVACLEACMHRHADALAVCAGDQQLSYAELDHRANRLAERLRGQGAGAETLVALDLRRGPLLLIGLMAIWKTGSAYLALDRDHPAAWRRQVLTESGARLLLTERPLALQGLARLSAQPPVDSAEGTPRDTDHGTVGDAPNEPWACLFADDEDLAPRDLSTVLAPTGPQHVAHPDAWAYCLYTSGTTGRPKGVAVGGRSLLAHALALKGRLGLRPGDRVLQSTPLSVDASLEEIVPTLLAGATIVMPPAPVLPGAAFMQFLCAHRVSVVSLSTSLWEYWVDAALGPQAASWRRPPDLRLVFVGGERVPAEKLRRWQALPWTQEVDWITDYGPTEATISCALYRPPRPFMGDLVPIGTPIAGALLHLLDETLAPVQDGQAGEIWIGGTAPARGYLGRAGLTADCFRPDPYGPPGSRMYRSGDLGRRLPDGNLLFLGRTDEQVKIAGHRIELGAIETHLLRCPGVRDAAVAAHPSPLGPLGLVGYMVGEGVDLQEVRRALAQALPAPMVPDRFMMLAQLPRSGVNGKLDRKRLPAPTSAPADTPLEGPVLALVRRRWTEILGATPEQDETNFFQVGGDSLRGLRLLAQLRADLGIDADFSDLHEHPTLGGLARVLAARPACATLATHPASGWPQTPDLWPRSHPASRAQRRLWFIERLQEGTASYAVPLAFRLRGPFSFDRLDLALTTLVARHEALRTGLVMEGDDVMQVIAAPSPIRTDLRQACSLKEAQEMAERALAQPFDLASPPLLRSLGFRLGPEHWLWVLNVHHSACDAWSLALLLDELSAVLTDRSLPEAPPPYTAAVDRQEAWLSQPHAQAQRAFWQACLAGDIPRLNLERRSDLTSGDARRGAIEPVRIDPALAQALRHAAAEQGTTPFAVALAAFGALLQRWTLQDSVMIGVPVACRPTPGDEATVGLFANTLPIRLDIEPGEGLGAVISQARERLAAAMAHQELPLDEVVDALGLMNRGTSDPVFQTLFVLQDAPLGQGFRPPGCAVEEHVLHNGSAKTDLCLMLRSEPGGVGWTGELEYRTDLLAPSTARHWVQSYLQLLRAGLSRPDHPINGLALCAGVDATAQVRAINARHQVYDDRASLGDRVFRRARAQPWAIAIEAADAIMSYGELARRAGQWARALTDAGVGPDDRVGVCMDRSAAMLTALLGILWAGAGFVPLSPRAPRQRTADIVAHAGIVHIIAQPRYSEALDDLGVRLWLEAGQGGANEPAPVAVQSGNLAYLYYTSGSTGTPKGVAIDHACAMNRLLWLSQRYPLQTGDRVLHKTPLIFDVAIWEIFGPLMAGATSLVADPGAEADPDQLAALLACPRLVFAHFVPSLLDAYLRAQPALPGPDLRWVQLSGEAPSPGLVERFRRYAEKAARAGGAPLAIHNCYGQTETSEVALWEDPGTRLGPRVPLGSQVGIFRLFVLDEDLNPVPDGMPGELCVSGVHGLARGYHGQPAATADRFVPHPFPLQPGERLYRTGDLARVNPQGALECLGRRDQQVKLRGCRVELGEIERVVLGFPGVKQCCVQMLKDAGGDDQLVAYLVGEVQSLQALARHLERQLPDYMWPSVYVPMDALPLTPSGKLDRLRLPRPTAADVAWRGGSESPAPGLECEVAQLWQDILGIGAVGRQDNFFALGGNSLKAIQVLTRIRSSLGVRVAVRDFFAEPTVAGLTRHVDAALVAFVAALSDEEAARQMERTAP